MTAYEFLIAAIVFLPLLVKFAPAAAARVLLSLAQTVRYRRRWLEAVRLLEALVDDDNKDRAKLQKTRARLSQSEAARRAQVQQIAQLALEVAELELRLGQKSTEAEVARANLHTAQQLADEKARSAREEAGLAQIMQRINGAPQNAVELYLTQVAARKRMTP